MISTFLHPKREGAQFTCALCKSQFVVIKMSASIQSNVFLCYQSAQKHSSHFVFTILMIVYMIYVLIESSLFQAKSDYFVEAF